MRAAVIDSRATDGRRAGLKALATALCLLCSGVAMAGPWLNEIVAVNQLGLRDDRDSRPDWIELHNPSDTALDLAGWSLSDDPSRPRRWSFVEAEIPPSGYLLVYASGENRQAPAAVPAEPSSVPGLVAWYRADRILDDAPGAVRTVDGVSYVRSWLDLSGRGFPLEQDAPGRQPILVSGAHPAVRFDGSEDLLRRRSPGATNDFTLVCVATPFAGHEIDPQSTSGIGGVSGQRWLFGANHGGDLDAGVGLSAGTNGFSIYEHGSAYMPAVAVHGRAGRGATRVVSITYEARRPSLALAGLSDPAGEVSPRRRVVAPTDVGSGAYGAFAGDVREIALFDRALTESERRGVELALAFRHGLELERVYHTNFRLDGGGESVLLADPSGQVVDRVRFPALPRDVSWGRHPATPGEWVFFAEPTPGAPNTTTPSGTTLSPPHLSVPPGFQPAPFSLVLSSADPDAEIRYTLDGSEPGESSLLYTAPVGILNRSTQANRFSAIPTAPNWRAPAGPVFKGTVVRARAYRTNAVPSDVVTGTYFVHPSARARFTLPVVALTTAASNLFDADHGIYVQGKAPGGNYAQSGDVWERPVFVEFFETNAQRTLAAESGLRIHGNTSFQFPVKGLRLHALNQKGTGPFEGRLFPDRPTDRFDRLLLRPSGHDYNLTLMRDGLMQAVSAETGLDVQAYRPALVFLNGEYWGIHNMQEAFERNYFAAHHPGVDPLAIDYLEGYPPGLFVYEGSADGYLELIQYLEAHGAASETDLAWAADRMDLRNFQDYKIAEIFHVRWDIGNHRVWRTHGPDARFRWILFDCDVGFGGFGSQPNAWSFDMLEADLEPSGSLNGHNNPTTVFLLRTLLENPQFRSDFITRFADLLNTTYAPDRILAVIDRMAAEIAPEIREHTDRWRAPASVRDWQNQVEQLRTFARLRGPSARSHLARRFGLKGVAQLHLASNHPEAGQLRCNTVSPVPLADGHWIGTYFLQHPVTIEAIPAEGWRFVGWQELPGITTPRVVLALQADSMITALFARDEPPRITGIRRLDSGAVEVSARLAPGAVALFEGSHDFQQWTSLLEVTADARGEVTWAAVVGEGARFIRLRVRAP